MSEWSIVFFCVVSFLAGYLMRVMIEMLKYDKKDILIQLNKGGKTNDKSK